MCCTDTDLAQLLQDVLNPDNFQRNEAENRLRMLCVTPGGATRLAQQTCSGLLSHSQSLVALSTLKQVAIPSVRSGKELLEVLQLLLRALESRLDLQESMQKQMASVVAKVVTVMESSGDSLCGSNNQFYANAIAMITERIQDPLRHDATQQYQHGLVLLLELMEVIAEESLLWEEFLGLVPQLLQVGLAEGAAREGVTSENLEVVMANLQRQSLAQKAVSRLLQQSVQLSDAKESQRTWRNYWCEYFSIIQERYLTVPCSTFFSQTLPPRLLQRLQLAQLTCLSLGVSLGVDVLRSGSQRKTLVTSSLPQGILMALNLDTTLFHQVSVNGAESEAECDDLEALLSQIVSMRWSLFGTLALRPTAVQLRKEVLGGEGPSLAYLQLIQAYTYLPQRCARAWEEDPCSFLRQESEREDELFWTCRDVVASIYEKSIQVIGPIFMRDSLEYFHEQICDEANMLGHDHEREAALFLMQQVVCSCRAAIVRWGAPDFSYLFNIVLSHDAHGIPILAARALSLLTELVLFMSQSGVDVYLLTDTCLLPQALQSLESCCPSGDALNVVQVSACKLLFRTMDRLRPSTVGEKFSEGQLALLRLIENSNLHDEALYLVFDTLRKWLECVHKLHEHPTSSAPAQYSLHPTFHKSLFQSWRSHIQDPNVNELVVPLFRLALCSPGGEVGLLEELPWISKVLEDQTDDAMRCVTPYVIRLLRTLFRHGSDQVAEQFAQQSLGSLCALLLTTDESASLDASSGCLSALLRRCPQVDSIQVAAAPAALVMAMPNNPTSVLPNPSLSSALAAIVVRILDPSLPEVILRNIGRTLVTFLTYAAHFHESDIQSIIIANVERLQMVKMESVAEQLVLPLAYLLQKYPDALLSLLEQRGLVVHTFEQWLPRVMNLTSRSDILHTCETLLSWLGSSLAASRDLSQCMVSLSFSINTLGPQLTAAQPTYSLPLDLAIVIAVNRALCALLQRGDADGFGASEGSSTNSEDDKGLFREDDEDSTWTEAEEVEEGEEDTVPATAHTTAAILSERPHAAVAEAQSQMIRAFAGLLPLLPAFGSQASNYFSSTEQARISDFLQLMQAELGSS